MASSVRRLFLSPRNIQGCVPLIRRSASRINEQIYGSSPSARFATDTKGAGGKQDANGEDDVFGVNFDDGNDHGKVGPNVPPKYRRDAVTGKFTGEKEREISDKERHLLNMDPIREEEVSKKDA